MLAYPDGLGEAVVETAERAVAQMSNITAQRPGGPHGCPRCENNHIVAILLQGAVKATIAGDFVIENQDGEAALKEAMENLGHAQDLIELLAATIGGLMKNMPDITINGQAFQYDRSNFMIAAVQGLNSGFTAEYRPVNPNKMN